MPRETVEQQQQRINRDAAIVEEYRQGGQTMAQVAEAYGVSEQTVRRAIKAAGLRGRGPREGMTPERLSRALAAYELRKGGMQYKDIAARFGVTKQCIQLDLQLAEAQGLIGKVKRRRGARTPNLG